MTLTKPALDALTDQAFAATADTRRGQPAFAIADAGHIAAKLAEQFQGDEDIAARAVMAVVLLLGGGLLARYDDFPGGLGHVPTGLALAAEQVAREAGAS
ncbi:MAG TPA: hypothetical protein VHZ03_14135 [Trebonia sp.]|jgi:hypothetical protein|nr:hypothetical protein [Trebonia sp.]